MGNTSDQLKRIEKDILRYSFMELLGSIIAGLALFEKLGRSESIASPVAQDCLLVVGVVVLLCSIYKTFKLNRHKSALMDRVMKQHHSM